MNNNKDEIVLFENGELALEVNVSPQLETVWLSSNQMALLYGRDEKTIRKHVNKIFTDGELERESNTQKMRVAGVSQPVAFYNLDVIISVGYRVNSKQGIAFRKWANSILKQYIIQGYPYNVFRGKYIEPFVFSPITVFYGNNGSGKSTLLNIIANKLQLKGKEYATSNSFGIVDYCNAFSNECSYSLGEDDFGFVIKQEEYIKFAQEKYSNGETSMQYFEEYLQPNALYLLDEPEVSLSPSNQVLLANEINKLARLLECQFVIATHSPFMLGTLNAKIYNIDTKEYDVVKWNELENVQYFYNFFKKHEQEFEEVIHESGE